MKVLEKGCLSFCCEPCIVIRQTRSPLLLLHFQTVQLQKSTVPGSLWPNILYHFAPGNTCLLELVLSGAAYLGGESFSQFLQAPGVLQLDLSLPAEELLQVLQQLQARLRLLLQTFELLDQLSSDFCTHTREKKKNIQCQQQTLPRKVVFPCLRANCTGSVRAGSLTSLRFNSRLAKANRFFFFQERAEEFHSPASY